MHRLTCLLATVCIACSPVVSGRGDTGAATGTDFGTDLRQGSARDAGPNTATDAGDRPDSDAAPAQFSIPATQGTYDLPFTVAIAGSGNGRYGQVDIANGSGSLQIDGEMWPLGVYQQQQWDAFGYTLYQAIAVSDDAWYVIWFYCSAGVLTDIWAEGTDGSPLQTVTASGTCAESATPSTAAVAFPAVDMPTPTLLDGFSVSGADVGISPGESGFVRVGGTEFDVYPFSHVDCTQDCGPAGWHELHALLWDTDTESLCFAIFYLFLDDRAPLLAYAFSLPTLTAPFGTVEFTGATWNAL